MKRYYISRSFELKFVCLCHPLNLLFKVVILRQHISFPHKA